MIVRGSITTGPIAGALADALHALEDQRMVGLAPGLIDPRHGGDQELAADLPMVLAPCLAGGLVVLVVLQVRSTACPRGGPVPRAVRGSDAS